MSERCGRSDDGWSEEGTIGVFLRREEGASTGEGRFNGGREGAMMGRGKVRGSMKKGLMRRGLSGKSLGACRYVYGSASCE